MCIGKLKKKIINQFSFKEIFDIVFKKQKPSKVLNCCKLFIILSNDYLKPTIRVQKFSFKRFFLNILLKSLSYNCKTIKL